jgi:hypothetical protein
MIVRDARSADVSAVHRLIGQLVDAPDEGEFRVRFERVTAGRAKTCRTPAILPSISATLYSRIDRKRAQAFYERIGYRVKGTSVRMDRAFGRS